MRNPWTTRECASWLEGEILEVRDVGTGLYAVVLTATGQVIGGVLVKRRAVDDDHPAGDEPPASHRVGRPVSRPLGAGPVSVTPSTDGRVWPLCVLP